VLTDSPLQRRTLLIGAGVGALMPVPVMGQSPPYRFDDPNEMLKLFVRMNASLDGATYYGWYAGHAFGNMPGEMMRPLCGFEGFGVGWVKAQPDGTYQSAYKEVGYYKDLKTGEIIERWTNPYTGEVCEVMHIHNASVNMLLTPKLPDYEAMAKKGATLGNPNLARADDPARPYGLPYVIAGDSVSLFYDVRGNVPNRLSPKEWPRESTGERTSIAEFYMMTAKTSDAFNPKLVNVPTTGAWTRVAPWLPWMLMGGQPGEMFYRSATKKFARREDLPRQIVAYTEKNYPAFLEPPTDFNTPMESSWDVYKRERKPAPPRKAG
jgi:hypothetical protein